MVTFKDTLKLVRRNLISRSYFVCTQTPYLEYDKDRKDLGDTPGEDPHRQKNHRRFLTFSDFSAIFESLPLVSYENRCFVNNV